MCPQSCPWVCPEPLPNPNYFLCPRAAEQNKGKQRGRKDSRRNKGCLESGTDRPGWGCRGGTLAPRRRLWPRWDHWGWPAGRRWDWGGCPGRSHIPPGTPRGGRGRPAQKTSAVLTLRRHSTLIEYAPSGPQSSTCSFTTSFAINSRFRLAFSKHFRVNGLMGRLVFSENQPRTCYLNAKRLEMPLLLSSADKQGAAWQVHSLLKTHSEHCSRTIATFDSLFIKRLGLIFFKLVKKASR